MSASISSLASKPSSPNSSWPKRLLARPLAVASGLILLMMITAVMLAPLAKSYLELDATSVDLFNRLLPADQTYLMGTDELGRDLFLRLLYGGQTSLMVGLVGALLTAMIGTIIGLVAGFVGGRTDAILMRLTDAIIALPILPLLIVLAAIDLGKLGVSDDIANSPFMSVWRIIIIIAIFGWTTVARLVRGSVLSIREQDFVRAARALGCGPWRLMISHILPSVASPIIVATTLSIGNIILTESILSFLGLGIQPPLASWGSMLSSAQDLMWEAPHLAYYPGLLIFLAVITFNLLGDGLQDALDPKADRR